MRRVALWRFCAQRKVDYGISGPRRVIRGRGSLDRPSHRCDAEPPMKRHVLPLAIALLLVPGFALAQPAKSGTEVAAAEGLFYEARTLMQAGKFAEACPKLEESMRLDPGIGTQFNLADCNEHLGKIATAWTAFNDAAAQSKLSNQPDREKVARSRAAALEPRLPRLAVDVTGAPAGLEVKRDALVVGAPAWGTLVPVDPGTHRISASAPGKQPWETTVTTREGKVTRVSVPRDLPDLGAPPAAVAIGPGPATLAAEPFPEAIVESHGGAQRAVGWIVTTLGVASVGVGAGFGLSSLGKRNDARTHCTDAGCDAEGVSLRDDALRSGNISTITMIAGGAALAGGILLVLTAARDEPPHERAGRIRAVPTTASGGGGLSLQGVFQ
jgi:hypothetical protein